jgi:hypothetical protein
MKDTESLRVYCIFEQHDGCFYDALRAAHKTREAAEKHLYELNKREDFTGYVRVVEVQE